jgi:tetratricopeptide (TPR) repeat protein
VRTFDEAKAEAARRQRLIPLLEERAAVERLSYDHEAAKTTLRELLALDPERVWSWIELGDLLVTTAALDQAVNAFRHSLAVTERLAKADPGNAGWQRDLSVSHNKIGDVQVEQGDLAAALTSYQASHDIFERLAKADPGNAGWQRDLALSYGRVAIVKVQQGAREDALGALRHGRNIISRLARQSPSNATLPIDLTWFDSQIAAQEKPA